MASPHLAFGQCDPEADFTTNRDYYVITFTGQETTDGCVQHLWDFGDGSPLNTDSEPVHLYTAQGIYTIVHWLFTDTGTKRCEAQLTVQPCSNTCDETNPAHFTYTVGTGDHSCVVSFDGNFFCCPFIASWDFGDGTDPLQGPDPIYSLEDPDHLYWGSGTYTVTHCVLYQGVEYCCERDVTVTACDFDCDPEIAGFTVLQDPLNQGNDCKVQLIADHLYPNCPSNGQSPCFGDGDELLVAYSWVFTDADGTITTVTDDYNPSHTFESTGTHTISLTVFVQEEVNGTIVEYSATCEETISCDPPQDCTDADFTCEVINDCERGIEIIVTSQCSGKGFFNEWDIHNENVITQALSYQTNLTNFSTYQTPSIQIVHSILNAATMEVIDTETKTLTFSDFGIEGTFVGEAGVVTPPSRCI